MMDLVFYMGAGAQVNSALIETVLKWRCAALA